MSEFDEDKDYQKLHSQYQAAATELPPASVDDSILQASRDDLNMQNSPGIDTQPVKRAWYVPASYVAILVLSLSVVMKLAFEPNLVDTDIPDNELDSASLDSAPPGSAPLESTPHESASKELVLPSTTRMKAFSNAQPERQIDQPPAAKSAPARAKTQSTIESLQITVERKASQKKQLSRQLIIVDKSSEELKPALVEKNIPEIAAQSAINSVEEVSGAGVASASFSADAEDMMPEETETQDSTQEVQINKLVKLHDSQQFEKLKLALLEYRKLYPSNIIEEKLPQVLLDWEAENIPATSQSR